MNRILLVEARPDLADLLDGMLLELDFEVVIATTLNAAITAAHSADVGLALLEVNLGSLRSYPVAEVLRARGIPFAFINSQGRSALDHAYSSTPVLVKPFNRQQLHKVIDLLKSLKQSPPIHSADP